MHISIICVISCFHTNVHSHIVNIDDGSRLSHTRSIIHTLTVSFVICWSTLSSPTPVFMFSTQTASTGPSNSTQWWFPLAPSDTAVRIRLEAMPSCSRGRGRKGSREVWMGSGGGKLWRGAERSADRTS